MKRGQLAKHVALTMRVYASAMHWYDRNVARGCVRGNFSDQSRQLWDACTALREAEKQAKL